MQPVKLVWSILDFYLKARNLSSHEGPEAVTQRCSVKKLFLEILLNSQENTFPRVSFLNKVAGLSLHDSFIKKRGSGTGVFL